MLPILSNGKMKSMQPASTAACGMGLNFAVSGDRARVMPLASFMARIARMPVEPT
ncbi:MAG TPA: hypothetical protein VFP59_00910 [Candidatus Angelobacter sp.]|nr:hypothetical protein [Candidatus Angelobacter sp.]